jgi:hypothetical protein
MGPFYYYIIYLFNNIHERPFTITYYLFVVESKFMLRVLGRLYEETFEQLRIDI